MRLIKPSFEIITQKQGVEGMFRHIELAARTCYKSEDNITEGSSKGFVEKMIKWGHTSTLEHGTVYLTIPENSKLLFDDESAVSSKDFQKLTNSPYSQAFCGFGIWYITTNYRVLSEMLLTNLAENFWASSSHQHSKRYSVRFVCDRAISHEFVRHRKFSFSQESTRYCSYKRAKFGGELTYIQPLWTYGKETEDRCLAFFDFLHEAEAAYLALLSNGWKPEQARAVLPNCLKTELVMTGFASDWQHFFFLRATNMNGQPHPQAVEIARPLMEEFADRGYV